ncbi:hypothetical protein SAMN06265373_1126 [Shimia sagamensis]|uniref:Uncharacterized protein n=1 Tax=Shimia sagamensis TaxID=1566352 RepID=A0ABY1PJG8_9RHOB|nr:hypothetical protein SAMN06265373_1126 [Shimia sagamensis]
MTPNVRKMIVALHAKVMISRPPKWPILAAYFCRGNALHTLAALDRREQDVAARFHNRPLLVERQCTA